MLAYTAVAIGVVLALAAFSVDVGSWFRADRQAQTVADAAALAGAQALPLDTSTASSLAYEYAVKNGAADGVEAVTFSTEVEPNDTITVEVKQSAPAFFAKVFGLDSVAVHARATARAGLISAARYVAPMVIKEDDPILTGCSGPCFGKETSFYLNDKGAPGSFGLINLGAETNPGTRRLAEWVRKGYSGYLPLGDYFQRSGSPFTSALVQRAMNDRLYTTLLFPIFRYIEGQGSKARYRVIGWAAFYLTDWDAKGNEAAITGYLTETVWHGVQSASATEPDFGVRTIRLVE